MLNINTRVPGLYIIMRRIASIPLVAGNVALTLEQSPVPFTHDRVIVHEQYAQGSIGLLGHQHSPIPGSRDVNPRCRPGSSLISYRQADDTSELLTRLIRPCRLPRINLPPSSANSRLRCAGAVVTV
jgi:hypothetical protein